MNIKSKISKLMSGLLCFSMIFSNALPAYAADAVITENTLDGEDLSVNERNLEDITVTYKQASSFFVTIPKTIVLDGWKQSTYAVKVSGDIDAEQCVYVAPVDMIDETENIDFYMKDQASENAKDDVVASVTHNKFHWNSAEVTEGYRQDDNLVEAPDLTAGAWRGIFQMEIKLETHVTHKHNYVETITKEPTCTETGEKKYTCDCGDGYTEVIPAKGHHFENGECTDCGEKDPDHKHSYTETINKQPTCTEAGEKTYTCKCGDSYTEVIPATGHHYGDDDKCIGCGELNPDHKHSYTETITKEPTCTEKGVKTYICGCGHSYTEEIPAKGHHYENGECTDCGESDPSHTHSYNEGVVTKEPTCTEKGVKTFTCSGCGHTYTEEIPATGHSYLDIRAWENTSNGSYAFVKEGTKWISNNKGVQSSTAISTWTITLDKDTEYSFKYKVSSEDRYDKLTITLDSTTVANAISGAGTEQTYTTTLTAGTHTLTATYAKDSSTDKNDDCGYVILEEITEELIKITKEPTCIEKGEKTFTCSRCGHIHTEEIPATGHSYENGKCTNCGETDPSHVHNYTPYVFTVEPTLVSSVKNNDATTVKAWALNASNDEYNRYYTSVIHPKIGYRCTTTATFEMNLPNDYEGEFDYKYGYVCNPHSSTANTSKQYVITMTINGTKVYENYKGSISGAASNNTTIPLKAGKNTFTVKYDGYNINNSGVYSTSETSTATLTLYKCSLYDGTQYHICNECGKKEEHVFGVTVTKEATCTEAGEKVYTCDICKGQFTEEIPATGHNYVDGVCDKCGDLNLKLTTTPLFSASTSTSTTTDSGHGHYDQAILNGTYSDEIEITEDMGENDYLHLYFTVTRPNSATTAADPVSGSSMLQKYDEETGTWKTIYSYSMSYSNLTDFSMRNAEGGGGNGRTEWISRNFQLEKGKYRVYGEFTGKKSCASSTDHHYWSYSIRASLCRMEMETETP